jgi:hypothetical protein
VIVATALWVVLVGAGYAVSGLDFAVGVSIGGALMLVNFRLLAQATARTLGLAPPRPRRDVVISALRWTGTAAVLMAALWIVDVDPAGLLVGLSVVVAAILLAAALGLVRG